jgi:tetratricopeptide (TPR) repeat protein
VLAATAIRFIEGQSKGGSLLRRYGLGIAFVIIAALALYVMVLTKSRTAALGAGAWLVLGVLSWTIFRPLWRRWAQLEARYSWPLTWIGLAVVVVGCSAVVWVYPQWYSANIAPKGEAAFEGSIYERLMLWDATCRMIQDYIAFGVGAGNWKITVPTYQLQYANFMTGNIHFDKAHQDILTFGAELGLVGMCLYVLWLVLPIGRALSLFGSAATSTERVLYVALGMAGVQFVVDSCLNFPKDRFETWIGFALVLACVAQGYGTANIDSTSQTNIPTAGLPMGPPSRSTFVVLGLLGAIFVVMGIGGYRMARARFGNERATRLALASHNIQQWEFMRSAIDKYYSPLATLTPATVPLIWYRAIALQSMGGQEAQAHQDFLAAYEAHPNNMVVLNNLASSYAVMGQHQNAIETYQKALTISPTFQDALINLTAAYYNSGDFGAALKTINRCDSTQTAWQPTIREFRTAIVYAMDSVAQQQKARDK